MHNHETASDSSDDSNDTERGEHNDHSDDHSDNFRRFAGPNGAYYARVFLALQQEKLGRWHLNKAAMLGGCWWAAMRKSQLLFWIGFAIDLMVATNLALVYKYLGASAQAALDNKAFLVERYDGWASSNLLAAIVIFCAGRFVFGLIADRLYYRQYSRWRLNRELPHSIRSNRLIHALVLVSLIAPLTLYRASQFAPEERSCIKQARAISNGEIVAFKQRFDCMFIGEFPTLVWLERPREYSFPRGEDGTRTVVTKDPRANLPPITINVYVAQTIDTSIAYLQAFYGWIFDSITNFLRVMLGAIEAVFVGTPWIIMVGVFLAIAWSIAGRRIALFTGAGLLYIAMFGFWQTAMDTLSLVTAASIICIMLGLPTGIWVGKSKRGQAIITPILDIMQTIPSFVYLLPAVAFFSIGKPPGILATVIFAMPPMVRLTALGVRQVPESTKEAALAFGANPRQLLRKVELPLALPSIMAGINQVVMMSLSMVVVAALIGAGGMGFIVTEALANTKTGRGVLAGIAIALIAMMIDRIVQKANQKQS
ncbi:MAG: proline/glycine betaine ABC transporter permease [Pseudomonadota bacterium]